MPVCKQTKQWYVSLELWKLHPHITQHTQQTFKQYEDTYIIFLWNSVYTWTNDIYTYTLRVHIVFHSTLLRDNRHTFSKLCYMHWAKMCGYHYPIVYNFDTQAALEDPERHTSSFHLIHTGLDNEGNVVPLTPADTRTQHHARLGIEKCTYNEDMDTPLKPM